MPRQALEVADSFRDHGSAWRQVARDNQGERRATIRMRMATRFPQGADAVWRPERLGAAVPRARASRRQLRFFTAPSIRSLA